VCRAFSEVPAGVTLHGLVPSLEPYYADAAVVLNPVPYGTGLKIKTVEALCFGKALVTTPSGVIGLPRDGDLPYVIAEIGDMAAPVSELLASPDRRDALGAAALAFARGRFAPEVAYAGLEALLWQAARRNGYDDADTEVQEGSQA